VSFDYFFLTWSFKILIPLRCLSLSALTFLFVLLFTVYHGCVLCIPFHLEQDGFRGTYDEVEEHEKALASGHKPQQVGSQEVKHLYEAPDGFRGTFEEVEAHEAKLGRKYCEVTGEVIPHEPDGPLEPEEGQDAKVQDLLMEIGMGHFAVPFHKVGVDYQMEVEGEQAHNFLKFLSVHIYLTGVNALSFTPSLSMNQR